METLPLKKRFILSNEEDKQPESSDNKLNDKKDEKNSDKEEYDIDNPTTDPITIISLPYSHHNAKKQEDKVLDSKTINQTNITVINEKEKIEVTSTEKMVIEQNDIQSKIIESKDLDIKKSVDHEEKDVNKSNEVKVDKVTKKRKKISSEKESIKKKNKDSDEDNQQFINIDNDFGDTIRLDDFQTLKEFKDEELDDLYDRLSDISKKKLFKETIKQNPTNIILWYKLADSVDNINESINHKMQLFEREISNATSIMLDTMKLSDSNYIRDICSESFISQKENRNENLALNDVITKMLHYIEKILKKSHEYLIKGKLKPALQMINLIVNNYVQSSICKDSYITSEEEEHISNLFVKCLKNILYIENKTISSEEIYELIEKFEKCIIHESVKNIFRDNTAKIRKLL